MYAYVAAFDDDGIQIFDVTDPQHIITRGSITDADDDGSTTSLLDGPTDIAYFAYVGEQAGEFLAVTSLNENGVQILNVTQKSWTSPYHEVAVGGIASSTTMSAPEGVAFFRNQTSSDAYLLVTSTTNSGVQVVEIEPDTPVNINPVVVAGSNQTVNGGDTVRLGNDAIVLDHSDRSNLVYEWFHDTRVRGELPITIADESSLRTSFVAPHVLETFDPRFKLGVTDHHGGIGFGLVWITINGTDHPVVNAGPDMTVNENQFVTLTGTATDPDGNTPLTYLWEATTTSGEPAIIFDRPTSISTTLRAPVVSADATYTVKLTATDTVGARGSGTMSLLVVNVPSQPPVVDAGDNIEVDEGETVTLTATARDPEGESMTYDWTCRGNGDTINVGTSLSVTFTAPDVTHDTAYTCVFSAQDPKGSTGTDDLRLLVLHVPDDRPVLTIIGGYNPTVVTGTTWVDPGTTCVTLHDGVSLSVRVSGSADTSTAGSYKITYSCDHNGFTASNYRTVTVIPSASDERPTINILNNRGAIPTGLTNPDFGDDAVCTDREDGDISHTITVSVSYGSPDSDGNVRATLTYSCTDSGGHTARDRISVSVIDTPNHPPELHTNGGLIWIGVGETFTDPGAVCKDVEDGTWDANVVTNSVDTTTAGTYFVVYECIDSGGLRNAGGGARAVYVVAPEQNTPPSITVDDSDILVPLNGTWTIPDATCHDDEDGDLTYRIELYNVESVNVQKEGTYAFTMFCRDDGNEDGSDVREASVTIRVIVS